jgi:hypothetical protein
MLYRDGKEGSEVAEIQRCEDNRPDDQCGLLYDRARRRKQQTELNAAAISTFASTPTTRRTEKAQAFQEFGAS